MVTSVRAGLASPIHLTHSSRVGKLCPKAGLLRCQSANIREPLPCLVTGLGAYTVASYVSLPTIL